MDLKKYFQKSFPPVSGDANINRWLRCPRSKAACAAFLGTDYKLSRSEIVKSVPVRKLN